MTEKHTTSTEEALKKIKGIEILGRNINEEFVQVLVSDNKDLLNVLKALKKDSELHLDNLHCLTAADYIEYIEVVYQLYSYSSPHKVILKARVSRDACKLDSACSLWKTADWQEREVFELYGVEFIGHPNLRAILLTDEFDGYPFRKDVPLNNNEEWLLEDDTPIKDYGIPYDLESIYKQRKITDNGGKTR